MTLYPSDGFGGFDGQPVDIPPDRLDHAFRLLTPERYFEGGVYEFITRVVAEAVITHAGEWVRYSSPEPGGAEYIAVCLPAFSPETVHRDEA